VCGVYYYVALHVANALHKCCFLFFTFLFANIWNWRPLDTSKASLSLPISTSIKI